MWKKYNVHMGVNSFGYFILKKKKKENRFFKNIILGMQEMEDLEIKTIMVTLQWKSFITSKMK